MDGPAVKTCVQCGKQFPDGQLACPGCGTLVHQRELNSLAAEAMRLESFNPAGAALVWGKALQLLPANSVPYQQLRERIAALAAGWVAPVQGGPSPSGVAPSGYATSAYAPVAHVPVGDAGPEYATSATSGYGRPIRGSDPLGVALAKTAGSMLFSAVVYYFALFHNVTIAVGFVVLMLIHEMGHVFAMRYYRLSASPPIFIPFMGALINMRQAPPNALVESIVGVGGPFLGTIGALACYGVAIHSHNPLFREELLFVAQLGFMLNLFNLLPVPPLDGGRITAAISPWLWIPGLAGLGFMIYQEVRDGGGFGLVILSLVFFYAFPRIRATLKAKGRDIPYFRISRAASWGMALLYFGLGGILIYMFKFKLHGMAMFSGN